MTTTPQETTSPFDPQHLSDTARERLWMHFTRHSTFDEGGNVPVIVKGEGAYIWDAAGRRYLDGLAGLFVVQAGHGREELARAAYEQAKELAFFPRSWFEGYLKWDGIRVAEAAEPQFAVGGLEFGVGGCGKAGSYCQLPIAYCLLIHPHSPSPFLPGAKTCALFFPL